MGLALADVDPEAQAWLDRGSELVGTDLRTFLRRGHPDPVVAQVALVAVQLGAWRALARAGFVADAVAGHSLGEVTAWAASGAVDPAHVLEVVHLRAKLLAALAQQHPGGLVATSQVPDALPPDIVVAAINGPDEVVLSGPLPELLSYGRLVSKAGPWHHPWLAPAVEPLRAALRALPTRETLVRWASNRDGAFATDPADRLAEQLVRPVRFTDVLATLHAHELVVVGPGRVLRSLARRNARSAVVADTPEAISALAGSR